MLERAVTEPAALAAALPLTSAEVAALHRAPDLTILKIVCAPGMSFPPQYEVERALAHFAAANAALTGQ